MTMVGLPWERLEGKVQPWHRDRLAAVYVRQSTAGQVRDHQESTRLQYALVERAVALGWAASRVLVIDEDLGHSASGIDARPGFQRLVSEVGLDHVGIVLGIEMSRLARSGREWHQLLELCALAGALLGDPDGVYDPSDHNDRLLLGLKGTISEYLCRDLHNASYADPVVMPLHGDAALVEGPGTVASIGIVMGF
ncbi:resolvase-like protein [Streptomyces sp. 846.5]|nr:recombinase family protein [Streptomyces sp. 846.5]TDU01806.1 resolvase-like protein [Streptomyces sp. 846.5]